MSASQPSEAPRPSDQVTVVKETLGIIRLIKAHSAPQAEEAGILNDDTVSTAGRRVLESLNTSLAGELTKIVPTKRDISTENDAGERNSMEWLRTIAQRFARSNPVMPNDDMDLLGERLAMGESAEEATIRLGQEIAGVEYLRAIVVAQLTYLRDCPPDHLRNRTIGLRMTAYQKALSEINDVLTSIIEERAKVLSGTRGATSTIMRGMTL